MAILEKQRIALVKLDPPESNSTGGVVEKIIIWHGDTNDLGHDPYPYKNTPGYKCIPSEEAEAGWILQDKTGVLRDPNI